MRHRATTSFAHTLKICTNECIYFTNLKLIPDKDQSSPSLSPIYIVATTNFSKPARHVCAHSARRSATLCTQNVYCKVATHCFRRHHAITHIFVFIACLYFPRLYDGSLHSRHHTWRFICHHFHVVSNQTLVDALCFFHQETSSNVRASSHVCQA